MGIFSGLEKLINEHGSSVILKERLSQASEQFSILEAKVVALEAENATLRFEVANHKEQASISQALIEKIHNNNPHNFRCDFCGSGNLTQQSARKATNMRLLNKKVGTYLCNDCGKTSDHDIPITQPK
ncbi:hypothetical protein CCZ37_16145 [Vibrio qinghaiensis]|uniref:Uncharacterized protein n=1 Tax=Vibrio qinghaiensis TaxID=2025808 RepID=A0A223N2Z3_9VIBR|nr:hypothetical protein [Vibrio qinghaiensis]ASU24070.1 hypothetical protein CCZ37_16145 [Vibrio qinghaiensis]